MTMAFSADASGLFGTIKINGVSQLVIKSDGSLESPAGKVIGTSEGMVGTVSQLAGVPTGAIIERGSNANGEYVKFADGTLICSVVQLSPGGDTVAASGTVFRSAAITWTFPAAFIAEPTVAASSESSPRWVSSSSTTVSETSLYLFSGSSSATVTSPNAIAIGRWF